MGLGLNGKFNILQQSPHDFQAPKDVRAKPAEVKPETASWVPSRYNVRAVTEDGRLVLWNTYKGSMSVFKPEQRSAIEMLLSQKGFDAEAKGMVKYLFDRGFLLKEGTDEYRRIQLAYGQQQHRSDVLQLCLLASEDCNFRCHYCYEEFARGTMLPEVRSGVKKHVEKRVDKLNSLSIEWFGGEPLYGFAAIEELAPFFVDIAERHSLAYSSGMTTNGYLLTPEVAEKLLAWQILRYQITLDGPPEHHDCSRPARDGSGTFAVILENLQSLAARPDDYRVDLRVNWDRSNFPHMERFLDIVENSFRGDPRFRVRFHSVFDPGGPNSKNLQLCGLDEAVKLQVDLEREARRRGLDLGDDLREVRPFGSKVCYAARPYHFVIGASGKVMKCTIDLDMKDRNVVGHLMEDGEMELDYDKLALWCEPAFEHDGKCQKCVVLPLCMGSSCPLIRIESNRSPCIPLRKNAKKDLRNILETSRGGDARTVTVGDGGAVRSQQQVVIG